MQSKNKELNTLLSQHTADPSLNYNNLSMVLNGTIDAAVMGGYANYEKVENISYTVAAVQVHKCRRTGTVFCVIYPLYIYTA